MSISKLILGLFVSCLPCMSALAGLQIGGTRVLFDGSRQAATLSIMNKDEEANLVQSWLSAVDETSPAKDSFIITPPLFRLDAGEQAAIRIVRSGKPLPEDRESMFWLNIKGIPSTTETTGKNTLQIAINSEIKLIYRPAALKGSIPEKSAGKLEWRKVGAAIEVSNPSPNYMNLSTVIIDGKALDAPYFVAPFSTALIKEKKFPEHGKITWQVLNDFGMRGQEHTQTY